jgi:Fe2+ or Zn2+ uptake regulation protein
MRRTRQRAELLRVLQQTDRHPTAEWLLTEVRKALPHAGLATVYRLLGALEEEGRIAVVAADDGPRRYDAGTSPHCHVVCSECGRIADVPDLLGEHGRTEIERWTGYAVAHLRGSWVGLCPACRAATTAGTG